MYICIYKMIGQILANIFMIELKELWESFIQTLHSFKQIQKILFCHP